MSLKFQAQILKNPGMWKWDSDEEYIYFTDGAIARRIPAGDCLLNPEQFRQRKVCPTFSRMKSHGKKWMPAS